MEVSKFIIDENDVFVKDAEARNILESQSESMSEIQSEIDSQSVAYSEMFSEVDDDLALKQDTDSALKYDRASRTFTNVTIPANSDYQFNIPIPDGVTSPRPIYARTTSLSLVITNMYVVSPNMVVYMRNTSDTEVTVASVTVEVTYLYN